MISRRLLRIKVLHILYAYFKGKDEGIARYEKELFKSIDKSYDLYHLFFLLLIDVQEYASRRIDTARSKKIPSPSDLNPNLRFVNNRVIKQLVSTNRLYKYFDERKLNWSDNQDLIKQVYTAMIESDTYVKYMSAENDSYKLDQKFVLTFLSEYLVDNDLLYQTLEDDSIFWNDDIEFMLSMNIKTIQKSKAAATDINLLPLFKDEDDKEFVKKLYRMVVLDHEKNSEIIQEHIKNWDIDRIASLDLLVLEMAMTEILQFANIPIKVSFNEYIELVKFYSTDRSNAFVNGVLDKIINKLKKDGKVNKVGRGLQE